MSEAARLDSGESVSWRPIKSSYAVLL